MRNVLFGLLAINCVLILNSNTSTQTISTQLQIPNSIDTTKSLVISEVVVDTPPKIIIERDSIDILLDALIQVESRGDSTAVGDRGWAVGILQIWPITVREVNRILEKQGSDLRYGYTDRESVTKSIEMFHIWREYYHSDSDWETISRCWNGGPKGMDKSATVYYWSKVKKELDS